MDAIKIIDHFYPAGDPAREILLLHSTQVRDKALAILDASGLAGIDRTVVSNGAMLHDLGIRACHAPDIGCSGTEHYLTHGIAGAEMLREYGKICGENLEVYARICERHTGTGLSAAEIISRALPLPPRDLMPETMEEKLICLADKFFSKSGNFAEKPLAKVRASIARFGAENADRFETLLTLFKFNGGCLPQ